MLDLKFYFCVLRPSSKRMHRNIIGVQGKKSMWSSPRFFGSDNLFFAQPLGPQIFVKTYTHTSPLATKSGPTNEPHKKSKPYYT